MGIEPASPEFLQVILSQLNYETVREANLTDAVLSRAHHMVRFGK